MSRCYIFDIDGTLANASHRLHHLQKQPKDWDAFFGAQHLDEPHDHIVELARRLEAYDCIVFCTGRPKTYLTETVAWLRRQHFTPPLALYMRGADDRRDDDIVKSELLDRILADGWDPIMAFEDRARVVAMWRARGIPCAQIDDGNF